MATIIRTDGGLVPVRGGSRRRPWSPRDTLAGGLVLLAAGGLGWLSVQGLARELARIPANRFYELHQAELQSAAADGRVLDRARGLYERLPPGARGPLELRRAGALELIRGKAAPRAAADDAARARARLRASLAAEPQHPLTWAYLADVSLTLEWDPAAALRYLKASYHAAPLEPDFLPYRFELALRLAAVWDVEFLGQWRREVRAVFGPAGHRYRAEFVRLLQRYPPLRTAVRRLIEADPAALARYEAALANAR